MSREVEQAARIGAVTGLILALSSGVSGAATLAPDAVVASSLAVRAVEVATPFSAIAGNNLGSPKVVNGKLHFVDQRGRIYVENGGVFQTVLDLSATGTAPAGFTGDGRETVLDVAQGSGSDVFVATMTDTLPDDAPAARPLPSDPAYGGAPRYQVIYRYTRASNGSLTAPVALASVEAGAVGHMGGGLLGLDDGSVLFATGDSLTFGLDGRAAAQDDASHLSKILRIDGSTGAVTVVAKGLRNVQRLTWADADRTVVAFADIGGVVAEEINTVPLADLLDESEIENFGWGRNADGFAREGTFYIGPGAARAPGEAAPIGAAPLDEPGFVQPYAQFGREDLGFAAASGPVFSPDAFDTIIALFGELVSGRLMATTQGPSSSGGPVDVFKVDVQNAFGVSTSLLELAGAARADARFFNFENGGAGVLLEGAGRAFRLTEVQATAVPVPALGWAFAAVLAWMGFGRALRWVESRSGRPDRNRVSGGCRAA